MCAHWKNIRLDGQLIRNNFEKKNQCAVLCFVFNSND